MHPITREDVERFVDGDLISPADVRHIEQAIEQDPQVADWYEEAQAALSPSPAARQAIAREFDRIARSTYARLFWQAPAATSAQHDQAREATVELPGGEPVALEFLTDGSLLTVECDSLSANLRPASIALFTPCETELELIERPAPEPAAPDIRPRTPAEVDKLAAETPVELGAKPLPPPLADTPLSLACRTSQPEGWKTAPVCSHGGEFWLQEIPSVGVALRCRFPEHAALEGLKFRLRWEDLDSGRVYDEQKPLLVGRTENASRLGEGFLRLDLHRFQQLRDAGKLDLTVLFPAGPAPAWTDAAGFRDIVGDDFQTLILDEVEGRSPPQYQARFRNDDQRRLWTDPAACQMVRFESL